MHYDFRLEHAGVLVSWAVPKGPSPNPADKRLAVHVEDHPVEYVDFEGVIPPNNYGAGAVIVWDRGRWTALNDFDAGLSKGKLLFELRGHKLHGKWTLVKTKRSESEWLLIKERDGYANTSTTEDYPHDSVLSGRTVEQVASGDDRGARIAAGLRRAGAHEHSLSAKGLRPMLAVPGQAFSDPRWVFELKYDGYRMFAEKSSAGLRLYSRAGHDFTATFPDVSQSLAALPFERFIIDGEVVVADGRGLPSFALLQKRGRLTRRTDVARASLELPATFYAFDLLAFEGLDLTGLPLLERKAALKAALPSVGTVRFSEHVEGQGEALFEHAEQMGLEGVVAKRAASAYVARRSPDWVKTNAAKSDDFVVVGYLPDKQRGTDISALLLAQYCDGDLVFAGRVGSGFSSRDLKDLGGRCRAMRKGTAPTGAPAERKAVWLEPALVAQVKFKQRTSDGLLRQPVFMRLRDDKEPAECVLNTGVAETATVESVSLDVDESDDIRQVAFTNLDKVFWPDEGFTKGDLLRYYERVSEWLLPYLKDRPVVLTRYPDGIEGKSFYQKDAPVYAPSWIRLETMWSEHAEREIRYFVLDDLPSLLYVINLGAIPLHVWSSRVAALEKPDWCILDLDPKGAPFAHVVRIARHLRELCEDVGLETFVKTSGSTGLHVLIPLGALYTYEQSRTLAELLARFATKSLADIATIVRSVSEREGKVYIDYLQNGHGRLLVAPFSVRPLPQAPVSMPIDWRKVNGRLRIERFNIRTAVKHLRTHGDPLAPVLTGSIDMLTALDALTRRLAG